MKKESPENVFFVRYGKRDGILADILEYRGIVTFVYGEDVVEYMSLYTADGFTGTPIACDEGTGMGRKV